MLWLFMHGLNAGTPYPIQQVIHTCRLGWYLYCSPVSSGGLIVNIGCMYTPSGISTFHHPQECNVSDLGSASWILECNVTIHCRPALSTHVS